MAAFIDFELKKGFILDEERIRKLHDILCKRIDEIDKDLKPIYTVYRDDYYTYETEDITDIIKEENCKRNKINELTIKVEKEKSIDFNLYLSYDKRTKLHIEGEDRDIVFLLASDVKDFLKADVHTVINFKQLLSPFYRLIGLIAMAVSTIILFVSTKKLSYSMVSDSVKELINEGSINDKLNYLINCEIETKYGSINSYTTIITILLFISIISLILSIYKKNIINKCVNYFFPSYLFLIGNEILRYKKMKELRGKILWTIIVGVIVSVIAGIIVTRIS